jgi:hypothetical protein
MAVSTRPLQLLCAAIAAVDSPRELEKLRDLAREQWIDHAPFGQIQALLEHRAAQLDGRAATQLAFQLDPAEPRRLSRGAPPDDE